MAEEKVTGVMRELALSENDPNIKTFKVDICAQCVSDVICYTVFYSYYVLFS